jgi:phosphoadenosine phosphosulfate reductase
MFVAMRVTMVKKRLASGEPCRKCAQAEDLLKSRGLWSRVDEVVWADETQPSSAGMQLAARYGVELAPFFLVHEDGGQTTVYESVLKLVSERLSPVLGGVLLPPSPPTSTFGQTSTSATATAGPRLAVTDADVEAAARDLAGEPPSRILRWGLERFGASLALAFSGAEDVVLVHMASESGLPFSVFCLDTGRLHPETYRFIDVVRKRYGVEIALMTPQAEALQAFVKKKGLFSFYEDGHGECCGIRKVEPLRRALATYQAWATGQRRDQSPATRSAIAVVERDRAFSGAAGNALVKLNPLAAWTSAHTWQFIRDEGIPFNALHERGFISIGCEPCTRATLPGEHERAGRWWWEEATKRECGLHVKET